MIPARLHEDLREILVILRKEILEVMRDRRAFFFTFVFPLFLYPGLFFLARKLELRTGGEPSRELRVGLSGDYTRFHAGEIGTPDLEFVPGVTPDPALLTEQRMDVILEFSADGEGQSVRVHFDGAMSGTKATLERVSRLLESYRHRLQASRLAELGVQIDPGSIAQARDLDIADPGERAASILSRILPALLVLLLITGGAFVAMDVVAGEKERGTLETLFVHPVSSRNVVMAKLLAVMLCSATALGLNLAGIIVASSLGWGPQGWQESGLPVPAADRVAVLGVLLVPLTVLSSSVLLATSCLARSFREAQTYLLPVVLLGTTPALLAGLPQVQLNPATAWIPVANIALAVRDAVAGGLADSTTDRVAAVLAFVSTCGYAALGVNWSARLLTREEALLGSPSDPAPLSGVNARGSSRGVILFGAALLLVIYYVAPWLQSPGGRLGATGGVVATLLGLVLLPALLRVLAQRLSLREAWALRATSPGNLLLAAGIAPILALLNLAYMSLQLRWLPFSSEIRSAFEAVFDIGSLSPLNIVVVFVLLPALCEEPLWRGTVQGELEKDRSPRSVILTVALLFGLFHFSIHRFVPTAVFGAILAWARWRTRSILPCVVMHAVYNGSVIFVLGPLLESNPFCRGLLFHPLTLAAAGGAVFLAWRWVGRREPPRRWPR